jgi:hypothetical protein
VKIKLAARYGSQGAVTQFWFTHHQKSVILDAEVNTKNKIILVDCTSLIQIFDRGQIISEKSWLTSEGWIYVMAVTTRPPTRYSGRYRVV